MDLTEAEARADFEGDREMIRERVERLIRDFEDDPFEPLLLEEAKGMGRFLRSAIDLFEGHEEVLPYHFTDTVFLDQVTAAKEAMIEAQKHFEETNVAGMSCVYLLQKILERFDEIVFVDELPV